MNYAVERQRNVPESDNTRINSARITGLSYIDLGYNTVKAIKLRYEIHAKN